MSRARGLAALHRAFDQGLLVRATGSYLAGAVAAALLVTNVNLLYLHATPMTEPRYIRRLAGIHRLESRGVTK